MAVRGSEGSSLPSEPGVWGCACCSATVFDPVPGLLAPPAARRRRGLAAAGGPHRRAQPLCSVACSASPVEETQREARNVIAYGQRRFEIGQDAPDQPDWEQLSSRVVCVLGQNPSEYTLNGTNCYLVGTGPKRLLVDAGEEFVGGDAFMDVLSSAMAELGVEGLDGFLITHMHHDHYGNVHRLQEKYGPLPVYSNCSKVESSSGSQIPKQLEQRGLLGHFLDSRGEPRYNPKLDKEPVALPEDLDLEWARSLVKAFPGSTVGARLQYIFFFHWTLEKLLTTLESGRYPWHPLKDGDRIQTVGATLVAMHTPGHAIDHMSFLLEEEHALFSGDHVLGWGTTLVFNMQDYMATLRRMLSLKPTRLYPGHGGFIEDGVDILTRYMEHRERREEQAWEALASKSRPMPVMEIAKELYPNTPVDRLWMARDNVEKLFRKFAADGSVGAWTLSVDTGGTETLIPFEVPQSYGVRHLEEGLLWATKRAMAALPSPGRRSKL